MVTIITGCRWSAAIEDKANRLVSLAFGALAPVVVVVDPRAVPP